MHPTPLKICGIPFLKGETCIEMLNPSETHAKMQFELEKQKLMREIANQKIKNSKF